MRQQKSKISESTACDYLKHFSKFFHDHESKMELRLKKQFREQLDREAIEEFQKEYNYEIDEFSFYLGATFALNKLKKSEPIKTLCDVYRLPESIRKGLFERVFGEFFAVSAVQILNIVGYLPKDRKKSSYDDYGITELHPPDIFYLVGETYSRKIAGLRKTGKDAVKDIYSRGIFTRSEKEKIKNLVLPFYGDDFVNTYCSKDYLDYKTLNGIADAMYESMSKEKAHPKEIKLPDNKIDYIPQLYNSEKAYFDFFAENFHQFLMRKIVGKK